MLARAIARQCRLILCDEFTSALDPETTEDILALIKKLAKDLSLTIVLVTHDMNVVRECCDEIVVLEGGECIEKGAVASVLLNPQHPTTRSMVRGLFEKELPQRWQSELSDVPQKGGIALIRLFFTSSNAGSPIFATVIKSLGFDLNIVAGHIDHLRDQAFGSLIVSLAYTKDHLSSTIKAFQENGVSAQTLGFIPSTLRPSDHHV